MDGAHQLGDAQLAGLGEVRRAPQQHRETERCEEQQDAAWCEDKDGLLKDEGKVEAAAAVVADERAKGGIGGGRAHRGRGSVHDGRACWKKEKKKGMEMGKSGGNGAFMYEAAMREPSSAVYTWGKVQLLHTRCYWRFAGGDYVISWLVISATCLAAENFPNHHHRVPHAPSP